MATKQNKKSPQTQQNALPKGVTPREAEIIREVITRRKGLLERLAKQ